jgi:hypothetical protein
MSDRTRSSVRPGSLVGNADAPTENAPGEPKPVSATQSIPTTGTQRAQAPATGSTAADAPPAGGPSSAPPVPPATGAAPAVQKADTPAKSAQPATSAPPAKAAPPAQPVQGAQPVQAAPPVTSAQPAKSAPPAQPVQAAQGAQPVQAAPPVQTPPAVQPAAPIPPVPPVGGPADAGAAASARGSRIRGTARSGGRGPRRARLQLRHIDTWSALKISLVLSIALFFIWMVAVGVLYGVLNGLGVFDTLNDLFGQIGTASGGEAGEDVVTPGVVFGGAAVIGAINIVLLTALCTVGTFIYNLCSDLVGGLELTLSERD